MKASEAGAVKATARNSTIPPAPELPQLPGSARERPRHSGRPTPAQTGANAAARPGGEEMRPRAARKANATGLDLDVETLTTDTNKLQEQVGDDDIDAKTGIFLRLYRKCRYYDTSL